MKQIRRFVLDIFIRHTRQRNGAGRGRLGSCFILALLVASAIANSAHADDVPRILTVANVRAMDLGDSIYDSFYLVSYGDGTTVTPGDGAAGLFVRDGTSCTDNGGSELKDNDTPTKNCFRRQNVNGDLRQWGLTKGSDFDVFAQPTTDVSDAADRLNGEPSPTHGVFAALVALGIKTFHTSGVSLKLGTTLVIPAGGALTCDTSPVNNVHNADYTALPGSLILAHNAYIDAEANNDAEVYGCAAILPEWYINPAQAIEFDSPYDDFTTPPAAYADLEAIRANMVLAGDYAIRAGSGAKIHDISILGFDNCLYC